MLQGRYAGVYRIADTDPAQNEEWQWRITPTQNLAIVKQALAEAQQGAPIIRMRIAFDAQWQPKEVICERDYEQEPLRVLARAVGDGRWRYTISDAQRDYHQNLTLEPGTHIDMWTPQTNTATINRLGLAEGQSADITVLYIDPQTFQPSIVQQRYTRLENAAHSINALILDHAHHYRYDALNNDGTSRWTGDIWANSEGLVVDYPTLFELIAYEPREEV